ncbi:MAG TPA: FliG C-terminal domain-containing protein [Elusimicrobiota bacterium]|nr:FliG C-terminal domain-containing protein [Elusimicrobiota bacterium]
MISTYGRIKNSFVALALTASVGICILAFPLRAAQSGVETKIALEESLERRLKSVISQILGNDNVIVIVTAEMLTEEEKKKVETTPEETSVLPGVPLKEKIGERDDISALAIKESRTLIKKLAATVVLDVGVSKTDENVIKNVTTGLLGLKTDRGDSLEIQRMDFHRGEKGFNWRRFITPPDLWWTMGLALMAFFILFITAFFFGSFRVFIREFVKALRSYAESMEEQIKMIHMQKDREKELKGRAAELEEAAVPEPLLASPQKANGNGLSPAEENGKDSAPFSFLNGSHLRNLKILLKKENPDQIAIVVNYLPPSLANDVLASLDAAQQAEVMAQLSRVEELDPDLVKAVESKIKEKIAFVIGGEDRLQSFVDNADPLTQQSLLATIAKKDAPLSARLRNRLFTLEDLAKLEGPVLAVIVRRINTRALAGVLRELPKELQAKILSSLPAGSSAMLKEEIELSKPLPPQRLAQEQKRILDAIRRLNDEGVIQLRKGAAS